MKFIVEVRPPLPEDLAEVADKLAEAFSISTTKANGLLRRAPGPVTKPVSEREADVVAGIFQSAGLSVVTLPQPEGAAGEAAVIGGTPSAGDAPVQLEADATREAPVADREEATFAAPGTASLEDDGLEDGPDDGPGDGPDDGPDDRAVDGAWGGTVDGAGDGAVASEGARASDRAGDGEADGPATGTPEILGGAAAFGAAATAVRSATGREEALAGEVEDAAAGADADAAMGDVQDELADEFAFASEADRVMGGEVGGGFDADGDADMDRGRGMHDDDARDDVGHDLGDDAISVVGSDPGWAGDSHRTDPGLAADGAGADGAGADGAGADGAGADDVGADGAASVAATASSAVSEAGAPFETDPVTEHTDEHTAGPATVPDAGEPAVTASGSAAAYRSGVRDLQRHGGTTAAELGVHARGASRREPAASGGVRRRIVALGILPPSITLLLVVAAAAATLLPVLHRQEAAAAQRTAEAFASSVAGVSAGMPLGAPIVSAVLSDMTARSQAGLADQGLRYLVVTDERGLPLAGWHGDDVGIAGLPPEAGRAVAAAAAEATGGSGAASGDRSAEATPSNLGQQIADSWRTLLAAAGSGTLEPVVASAAVRDGNSVLGSVVVGMDRGATARAAGSALLTTLLLGLIPVLLALLAAMGLAGRVTGGLRYLLEATDRISRGDLEHAVQLDSKDELGQLARGIERMRVSLQEGLDRLRRRR